MGKWKFFSSAIMDYILLVHRAEMIGINLSIKLVIRLFMFSPQAD